MKIGIISDIHGNLEALKASLDFLEDKTDTIVSLGDIVGYGPDPETCVEIVSQKASILVRGNHEEYLVRDDMSALKETARLALIWTKEHLPSSFIEGFKEWQEKVEKSGVLYAHASVSNPLFKYLVSIKSVSEEFSILQQNICFVGHTHLPGGFKQSISDGKIETILPTFSGTLEVDIKQDYKYIINTGSVGQPRDGLPFACVGIHDLEEQTIVLHRITYPLKTTRDKIIKRGLPSILAKRIMQGI
ncbi:metallophosphatase family protein [bacterium]|nr:metallophosphatase family protein [bacterium]